MKLTVVGCSPAWPNPGRVHSGYLLEHEGGRLLVDCGPGVLSRLREAEGWPTVDAIVITHMHLDHYGDLVAWLWGHLHVPPPGTVGPQLWLPPGGHAELQRIASRFDEVFGLREYTDGESFDVAGFTVTPHAVLHYDQPTFGLRVDGGGTVVGFSADTGPTPALARIAAEADLFLCEATLDEPETGQRGHLTAGEAAAAAREAGASRLLLVHRAIELDLPAGLELAHDGQQLNL